MLRLSKHGTGNPADSILPQNTRRKSFSLIQTRTILFFFRETSVLVLQMVFFFKIFLEDMSPFCGATDTPVSDFWWRLLLVSKPEWVLPYSSLEEAYILCYTFPEIHLWCDTCWPLGGQHGSWAVSTYLPGIGGTRNQELSCHRSQCEIRQTLYRLSYPGSAFCRWFFCDVWKETRRHNYVNVT